MKMYKPLSKCPLCGGVLITCRASENAWLECKAHGKITIMHDTDDYFTDADLDALNGEGANVVHACFNCASRFTDNNRHCRDCQDANHWRPQ